MKNPPPFFDADAFDDRLYVSVRDNPCFRWGRRYSQTLWSLYHRHADTNFLREACLHFHQRFWEMYVGVAFLRTRFPVTKLGNSGPEFLVAIGSDRFCVEATALSAGDGPDRVPEEEDDDDGIVPPTDRILLRFTNCLIEKQRQRAKAIKNGLIGVGDGYILAINSRRIPHAAFGHVPPFSVRAFLPFGEQFIRYEMSGGVTESGFLPRDHVTKANSSAVSTAAFLDRSYSWISAVLHSTVDPINLARPFGRDFELIHNPYATHPLPTDSFRACGQWHFDPDRSQLTYQQPCSRSWSYYMREPSITHDAEQERRVDALENGRSSR